jgi:transposase
MPDQLALPFYLWTREAVQALIQQRTGVTLSRTSVGRYLAAWQFTPQKPVRRAIERDPVAVARWLTTEYPRLAARAKRQGAGIYWVDEMGVRSDDVVGRSYAPRGRTPVVAGTGKRFSCHMISGITNRGALAFMTYTGRFNQAVLLRFFQRLIRQAERKVLVILDGHPVHRGQQVAAWVAAHRRQIEVCFLPGYSPELNPDELLNQDTKQVTGRQRPRTQPQLRQIMRSHLRRRPRQPAIVRRFFQHPDTHYAA